MSNSRQERGDRGRAEGRHSYTPRQEDVASHRASSHRSPSHRTGSHRASSHRAPGGYRSERPRRQYDDQPRDGALSDLIGHLHAIDNRSYAAYKAIIGRYTAPLPGSAMARTASVSRCSSWRGVRPTLVSRWIRATSSRQ